MIQPYSNSRTMKFEGDSKSSDLLIGNFGDVEFIANGQFDLAGMIYNPKGAVEFDIAGTGAVSFNGICRKLTVKNASGNCRLDFSKLNCKEVKFISVEGGSQVIIGATRFISEAILKDDAILQCSDKTILINYTVSDKSQIERMPKLAS
ncbi:MAG: hypothetical protein RIF36_10000 [Imperialibacter sp.]|uniref:hypothetical protein n=1 Tax=Imperialibacter sp. TaxID=2038411 RepID=UPI0032ED1744